MESPPSQFGIRQRARKRVVIMRLKLLPPPIPGRNGCLLMSKRNSSPSAHGQARRSTAADSRPSERWREEGRRGERLSTAKSCAPCAGQKTSPRRACPSAETSACATCGAWKRGTAIHPCPDVRHQPGAGHNHRGSSASSGGGRSIITQTHISKRAEGREQRP